MEASELAERVQGMSDLLIVAPNLIACMAGICTMALLAIGGVLVRKH